AGSVSTKGTSRPTIASPAAISPRSAAVAARRSVASAASSDGRSASASGRAATRRAISPSAAAAKSTASRTPCAAVPRGVPRRPPEHVPHLVAPDVALPLLLAQVARVALALEQDEHVLGARAGDVEEPRLLRPLAVELLLAMLLQAQVSGHDPPARVDRPAHDAERVVERGHAVVGLRPAAQ